MATDRDLTTGSVPGRLYQMSWPMVVGIAATMSVPLADAYFLGQLGTRELAAISYTAPVVLTLMSLAIGLGAMAGEAFGQFVEKAVTGAAHGFSPFRRRTARSCRQGCSSPR